MVLVDTNIWIHLHRRQDAVVGQLLWSLVARNEAAICGQVWVEFIGGFRQEALRRSYAREFAGFPWLETTRAAHALAADMLAEHPKLGSGDVIIAATAIANNTILYTFDKAFQTLAPFGLRLLV